MKYIIALLFTLVLCGAYLSDSTSIVEAKAKPDLFKLVTSPAAVDEVNRSSLASVSEAEIVFNQKTSDEINVPKLTIPLFDGKRRDAVRVEFEERAGDDFTWRGKIGEQDVVLTFKNGYVAGLIYSDDGVYEIVPKGEKQLLVKLDQAKFPECGGEVKSGATEPPLKNSIAVGTDSGDRIDVLVVYTTPVKNSLGGDAQAGVFAQQAIDAANTAYRNSKIRLRLRLAGAMETAVVETGSLSTELPNIRSDATTATLRNNVNADLVSMISNSTDACGIGYLMSSTSGDSNFGYTVVSRTCAVGNLSFAHELGHNMGSQHNPENGSGALYPYGYGHYVNGVFRTVMSYVDPCTSGCTRQPYFSNPAILFNGYPTGINNARDNARSINNTADAIANYRYSGSSITMTNYNAGEHLPRLIGRNITWTSDNIIGNVKIEISRDEGTSWQTLVDPAPNNGSARVTISGQPSHRARIRISSINNTAISDSSVSNIFIR